jgi:hypothetical protein
VGFLKISDTFTRFRKGRTLAILEAGGDPVQSITGVQTGTGDIPANLRHVLPQYYGHMIGEEVFPGAPEATNLGTLFWVWWNAPLHRRMIYRLRRETSAHLARVNMGFLPDRPPACWSNGSIVLESTSPEQPLVARYACIAAYYLQDSLGVWRYFFIGLGYPDGIHVWGTKADFGRLNSKLAVSEKIMDLPMLLEGDVSIDTDEQLALIKFVFAASYYIDQNRFNAAVNPGPPVRNDQGKAMRHGGKITSLWSYADLSGGPEPAAHDISIPKETLDTSGLDLSPTIVSPHIRQRNDKIIIIDAYDSHRWRKPAVGEKRKL